VITQAIYDRYAADALLVSMLSTYQGAPAIFNSDPIPGKATLPAICISGVEADEPNDTKDLRGREIRRRIRIYTDATGSELLVDEIAERARELLHRRPLDLPGGEQNYVAEVTTVFTAPTDETLYGRAIEVRLLTLEAP
jgi:hypothetical protein